MILPKITNKTRVLFACISIPLFLRICDFSDRCPSRMVSRRIVWIESDGFLLIAPHCFAMLRLCVSPLRFASQSSADLCVFARSKPVLTACPAPYPPLAHHRRARSAVYVSCDRIAARLCIARWVSATVRPFRKIGSFPEDDRSAGLLHKPPGGVLATPLLRWVVALISPLCNGTFLKKGILRMIIIILPLRGVG